MLWAIDVGNTHIVVGVWDSSSWRAKWRLATEMAGTEDELAVSLSTLCRITGIDFAASGVVVASVVPPVNHSIEHLAEKWLKAPVKFLREGSQVGLPIRYNPPSAVGADRIANAIGVLTKWSAPVVVVDFGTATTFDCIDSQGVYAGGAILPGVEVGVQALYTKTAKLPKFELVAPDRAIGEDTVSSLQSGVMLGYAGGIDALARRIKGELGDAKVIATGGLGSIFLHLCEELDEYDANLTLDGLRIAWERMA